MNMRFIKTFIYHYIKKKQSIFNKIEYEMSLWHVCKAHTFYEIKYSIKDKII